MLRMHAVVQIIAVLCGAAFIWWWMHRYVRDVIIQVQPPPCVHFHVACFR